MCRAPQGTNPLRTANIWALGSVLSTQHLSLGRRVGASCVPAPRGCSRCGRRVLSPAVTLFCLPFPLRAPQQLTPRAASVSPGSPRCSQGETGTIQQVRKVTSDLRRVLGQAEDSLCVLHACARIHRHGGSVLLPGAPKLLPFLVPGVSQLQAVCVSLEIPRCGRSLMPLC